MHSADQCWFDHEKLEVYREAIAFVAWLIKRHSTREYEKGSGD
jgi:hypothetical protein